MMKKRNDQKSIVIVLVACVTALWCGHGAADSIIVAQYIAVVDAPVVDGLRTDDVWQDVPEYTTHDTVADITVTFQTAYTEDTIYFLIRFPDTTESRFHKRWFWDAPHDMYVLGSEREDTVVLKWNMNEHPVDLTLGGDEEYQADIWYWKAVRTDPVGYADDKYQVVSREAFEKAHALTTSTGATMYLTRKGDRGAAAFKMNIPEGYSGDVVDNYTVSAPSGSRGDIQAKGHWSDGEWTIEFSRALVTGNDDDVQFDRNNHYQFGLSRYEIAGRKHDDTIDEPLFGSGEISESLTLSFESPDAQE